VNLSLAQFAESFFLSKEKGRTSAEEQHPSAAPSSTVIGYPQDSHQQSVESQPPACHHKGSESTKRPSMSKITALFIPANCPQISISCSISSLQYRNDGPGDIETMRWRTPIAGRARFNSMPRSHCCFPPLLFLPSFQNLMRCREDLLATQKDLKC
jgi:hypothetical protein